MAKLGLDFIVLPEVEGLHQEGVRYAKAGDIPEALTSYGGAEELLDVGFTPIVEASRQLHIARIGRDRGFCAIRELIQTLADGAQDEDARLEAITTAADLAQEDLAGARALTQQVLDASEFIPLSEDAQSRAKAEHGATITLQARVASITGHALLSDEGAEVFTNARNWFDEAHGYVREGNSAYYAASNAINAALLERSLGNNNEARRWSAEAAVSAFAPFGLRDAVTASSTLVSRGLRLATRQRARNFILTHP